MLQWLIMFFYISWCWYRVLRNVNFTIVILFHCFKRVIRHFKRCILHLYSIINHLIRINCCNNLSPSIIYIYRITYVYIILRCNVYTWYLKLLDLKFLKYSFVISFYILLTHCFCNFITIRRWNGFNQIRLIYFSIGVYLLLSWCFLCNFRACLILWDYLLLLMVLCWWLKRVAHKKYWKINI